MDFTYLLEYSTVFPNRRPIDVNEILRKYNREMVVKACVVLDHSYGNCVFPDNNSPFFSNISKPHIGEIEEVGARILTTNNGEAVPFCPLRTILELLKIVFSIPVDEYKNTDKNEDFEWDLFKVILSLNEKLMSFRSDKSDFQLDELTFLSSYAQNDVTNSDIRSAFQTQTLYANQLFDFLDRVSSAINLGKRLKQYYGINDFKQYSCTIQRILALYVDERSRGEKGCPVLDVDKINDDNILSQNVIDKISMDINAYIPYKSTDAKRDDNVDYRYFRAHPLIHIKDNQYYLYNAQLIIERLYNSLFFDLKPLYDGSNFFNFYTKEFVEHYLFDKTMNSCVDRRRYQVVLPTVDEIKTQQFNPEVSGQPDFYIRQKCGYLFIIECKGIRLNGDLKDKANLTDLLGEVKNKLYEAKVRKKSGKMKNAPVGIGQLVNVIDGLQHYECNFDNVDEIPDEVIYYPMIVLEDYKLANSIGLISIINK